MLPIEKNARMVVGVMVQHFPTGASSNDLCQQFETQTGLARQSFYYALKYCKEQRWLIGGGRGQSYNLSPNGSWKEEPIQSTGTSIGVSRDKDQLEYLVDSQTRTIGELQDKVERLLDWSNGGDAGVALPSLVRIVGDSTASVRQRIKAAAAVFAYKVADSEVTTFVRRFLESVCTSTDIGNIDHKVEAAELLRRHEAPRVVSETIKPSYRDEVPKEPPEPLMQLLARRKARQEQRELEAIERLEREANPAERGMLLALLANRNGNGGDGTGESDGGSDDTSAS